MPRTKFSLSGEHLGTCNLGELVPISLFEVLPNETFQQHSNVLVRFAPMLAPIMHRCHARVHHFYCSSRNLAKEYTRQEPGTPFDWEDFITGGNDNADTQTIPTIALDGVKGNLPDHFELPVDDATRGFDVTGNNVNALPFVMLNFVFNEYYRDQDLVTERDWDDMTVPRIAWGKDYLTLARDSTQRGSAIAIPIGTTAPIESTGDGEPTFLDGNSNSRKLKGTNASAAAGWDANWVVTSNAIWDDPKLITNLASATGIDPIDFRRYMALQNWAEVRKKFGARYTEYMRYLGARMPFAPDRPEYLGGGVAPVNFSEVLQTAPDADDTNYGVGDMYGHGISALRGNSWRRTFDEHGYCMTLLSIRPRAVYQDGIHKMWLRQDKEDFFTKELELIGMTQVSIEEVYADPATPGEAFGWAPPYEDYRHGRSGVSGDFNDTLDYWHLARQFASEPSLNSTFITCNPSARIFAAAPAAADTLWVFAHNSIVGRRNIRRNPIARLM